MLNPLSVGWAPLTSTQQGCHLPVLGVMSGGGESVEGATSTATTQQGQAAVGGHPLFTRTRYLIGPSHPM